jgi:hypothetical protein
MENLKPLKLEQPSYTLRRKELNLFLDKNEFYLNYFSYNYLSINTYNSIPILNRDLSINQKVIFDEYPLLPFNYLRQSTIKSFFTSQRVDVPICFKKSKSLYSQTFELPLMKLVNMVMRKGLKSKVSNVFNFNFFNFFNFFQKKISTNNFYTWLSLHFSLNLLTLSSKLSINNFKLPAGASIDLLYNNQLHEDGVSFHSKSSFYFLFFESIKEYLPVFSFFVRKVDKSVRKNSRGKSGKYVIIWKYVPSYKRLYTTLRWFIKDLKFQKAKTFKLRFLRILEGFILNPKASFLVKLRQFVHIYVFENLKNKLMKSLKTTS